VIFSFDYSPPPSLVGMLILSLPQVVSIPALRFSEVHDGGGQMLQVLELQMFCSGSLHGHRLAVRPAAQEWPQ
jgi:hypothetical protein